MALSDAVAYAVAAWNLDEASGTRVDQVGSNDLTDNNTVGSTAGMFGNAADFERDNSEYLSRADNAALSMGNIDFMIRAWVKLESKPAGNMEVVSKGSSGTGEYYLGWSQADDRFSFSVFGQPGFGDQSSVLANNFGAPSTGVWYLLHAWHDSVNNLVGIAVNAGTANTAAADADGCIDGTGEFEIGSGYPHPGNYMDGLIDDVVLLKNYLLSADERTEDYNGGAGVAFADWDAAAGVGVTWELFHGASGASRWLLGQS